MLAGLELKIDGYSYHPNLLEFNIYTDFVFNKTKYKDFAFADESSFNDNDNTYDITLRFFKKKTISFEPFFRQTYSNASAIAVDGFTII